MIVDCDRCEVRGLACQDCVITVLLGALPGGVELDGTERLALDTLAEAGMVPPCSWWIGTERPNDGNGCLFWDYRRDNAERSATDCERSRRHIKLIGRADDAGGHGDAHRAQGPLCPISRLPVVTSLVTFRNLPETLR